LNVLPAKRGVSSAREREQMKDFVPTPRRLLEEAETSAQISVFAAIAWHRNKNGLAMPGVLRVAAMARVSKPTAIFAIDWLREHNFLEVFQRDGHRQARSYRFPDLEETGQKEIPVNDETGSSSLPLFHETGQKEIPEPVKNKPPNKTIKNRETISSRDKREPDNRHTLFKEATREYWQSKNHGIEMTWDASEGKVLSLLLKASPRLDLEAFRNLLRNRYRSDVNHAARPREWLDKATNYASGPLDRFNNPKGATDGKSGTSTTADRKVDSVVASTQAALARIDAMDFGEDGGARRLAG
jgi:hypothetical protein